jgi:hypothetical protein
MFIHLAVIRALHVLLLKPGLMGEEFDVAVNNQATICESTGYGTSDAELYDKKKRILHWVKSSLGFAPAMGDDKFAYRPNM